VYAAIRRYQVDPAVVDEVIQHVDEEFLDMLSKAPGFVSYYLVDSGDGVLTTISVFLEQEQAEASTKMAADWVQEHLARFVKEPPQVTTGSVRVHGGQ
jgi:hypothetical protein